MMLSRRLLNPELFSSFLKRVSLIEGVSCNIFQQSKRLAGHSHWQNVKHTKEAGDREKSKASQFYIKAVSQAIKSGNGIRDPKINLKLAAVLAEAKANSVPFSTLERVLKAETIGDPFIIEIQAQGGLFILVESRAKQVNTEKQRLAALVKRFGCSVLPSSGSIVKEFFDHVGVVTVAGGRETKLVDIDVATDLGINIGAHDVVTCTRDDGLVYEFYCEPLEVSQLKCTLENDHQIPVLEVNELYIPKVKVPVVSEVLKNLNEMYNRIRQNHEFVERIFDNVICLSENSK